MRGGSEWVSVRKRVREWERVRERVREREKVNAMLFSHDEHAKIVSDREMYGLEGKRREIKYELIKNRKDEKI